LFNITIHLSFGFTGNIRPSIEDILTAIEIQREKQKQYLAQRAAREKLTQGKLTTILK